MKTIPVRQGSAFFDQRVELDGTTYLLGFSWNARAEKWSLSVSADDGTLLVAGIALVVNRPLLRRYRYKDGLPPGELMVTDLTETIPAPGYEQLGTATDLLYFEAAEL